MIVAGVMSGTSADGINVALVRISGQPRHPKLQLLGHAEYPYPADVRRIVLASMNAASTSVAQLARLNFLLAELYADAVDKTRRRFRKTLDLVGCHGQTLYHQGTSADFLGHSIAVTWQIGDGSLVAQRLGVPVVSDFRPADMAAQGKGAPLVPFLDYLLYRDKRIGRIVQNIGGIGNLTAIPANAPATRVRAFDTGPGNMVIDAVTERLFRKPFDKDGRIAASGTVLEHVLASILREPFFLQPPPKTAGREEFGANFFSEFLRRCSDAKPADIVATATALTVRSIASSLQRFVIQRRKDYGEFVVSGGGARNPTLLQMLAAELAPLGLRLRTSDEFGIPSEAKEAVAFALLAYQTWNRLPSNIPSATGAKRAVILGKVSYV
ncbi:MAG TPA: anhydro-N-acetylmuramic acid kinase [Terriglobales bacterium]|nr:anhydro-N-acetylmuramic acid kinase [Terriglobales bacterium]